MPAILRSILAVVAGYVAMAAVVIAVTAALKQLAPAWMGAEGSPRPSYVTVNLAYSLAAAMLGGYVAAAIGSRAPLAHACALAGLVLILSIMSSLQMGRKQPLWYQIALVIVAPLGTRVGGLLRARA